MSLARKKEIGLQAECRPATDRPAYRPAVIKNGERAGGRKTFPLCVVSLDLQLGLLLLRSHEIEERESLAE